jgi:hypothetical protein
MSKHGRGRDGSFVDTPVNLLAGSSQSPLAATDEQAPRTDDSANQSVSNVAGIPAAALDHPFRSSRAATPSSDNAAHSSEPILPALPTSPSIPVDPVPPPAPMASLEPATTTVRKKIVSRVVQQLPVLPHAEEEAALFPPGSLVWAGGRGHRGGVWDRWPARIVDPASIPEFTDEVTPRKRLCQLFAHEERKFVTLFTSALRPYVAGPANKDQAFRDRRGRIAVCMANRVAVADSLGRISSGRVDEDAIRAVMSDDELTLLPPPLPVAAVARRQVPMIVASSALQACPVVKSPIRLKKLTSISVEAAPPKLRYAHDFIALAGAWSSEPRLSRDRTARDRDRRSKRVAAVKNRFCGTGFGDDMPEEAEGEEDHPRQSMDINDDATTGSGDGGVDESPKSTVVALVASEKSRPSVKRKRFDTGRTHEFDKAAVRLPSRKKLRSDDGHIADENMSGPTALHLPELRDNLSLLSVEQVSNVISQFVCQGLGVAKRLAVTNALTVGCAQYTLNGRALLAVRPEPAELAGILLEERAEHGRDGIFWATAEFIRLARSQAGPMCLAGLALFSSDV